VKRNGVVYPPLDVAHQSQPRRGCEGHALIANLLGQAGCQMGVPCEGGVVVSIEALPDPINEMKVRQ
jgi:hypothetical protein